MEKQKRSKVDDVKEEKTRCCHFCGFFFPASKLETLAVTISAFPLHATERVGKVHFVLSEIFSGMILLVCTHHMLRTSLVNLQSMNVSLLPGAQLRSTPKRYSNPSELKGCC